MYFDLHFMNASSKLHDVLGRKPYLWRPGFARADSVKEAERLITAGLTEAQAVRIVVWYTSGEYEQGRVNRKLWHGDLYDVMPGLKK